MAQAFYDEQDCAPDHDDEPLTFYVDICRNCGRTRNLLSDDDN